MPSASRRPPRGACGAHRSGAGEAGHDRRQGVDRVEADADGTQAEPLPAGLEVLDHLIDRPAQRVRGGEGLGRGEPEEGRQRLGDRVTIVGDGHEVHAGLELEVVEAIPGRGPDPRQLPFGGGLGGMLGGMLGGNLGNLAKIASQFDALGIDASKLAPFAKTALDFLQKNLSGDAKNEIAKLVSQFIK